MARGPTPIRAESTETPALAGPLEGLKFLDVDDLPGYDAAVSAGGQMGWGYYFPYLLSQHKPGRSAVLYAREENSVCVFILHLANARPRVDLYLAPVPMNVAVLRRCIERANDFNGDFSARVMRIDAKDVDEVGAARIRVRPRKSQYVFSPGAYADLAGQRFHTIRRNVALVDRLADVEVVPYLPTHRDACLALLDRWKTSHHDKHGTLGGVGTSRAAIALAGTLPENVLRGEVVLIGGRLVSFAFGGQIRPGVGAFFERKCETEIRGLSYFQLRSFLLRLRDFEAVNDGSDAGRPGLRQLKDSFRPVQMYGEYRGHQRIP